MIVGDVRLHSVRPLRSYYIHTLGWFPAAAMAAPVQRPDTAGLVDTTCMLRSRSDGDVLFRRYTAPATGPPARPPQRPARLSASSPPQAAAHGGVLA